MGKVFSYLIFFAIIFYLLDGSKFFDDLQGVVVQIANEAIPGINKIISSVNKKTKAAEAIPALQTFENIQSDKKSLQKNNSTEKTKQEIKDNQEHLDTVLEDEPKLTDKKENTLEFEDNDDFNDDSWNF